jgi:hypothetical protein
VCVFQGENTWFSFSAFQCNNCFSVSVNVSSGKKRVQDDIVIATKFAAYPWRLTPRQFVNACK